MSEPSNIEIFDNTVAKVLAELYDHFPIPIEITTLVPSDHDLITTPLFCDSQESADLFGGVCVPRDEQHRIVQARLTAIQGLSKRTEVNFWTIEWLRDAGYLRFSVCEKSSLSIDSHHFHHDESRQWFKYPTGISLVSARFDECVLTTKGLEVLRAIPQSLETQGRSLGETLKQEAKTTGSIVRSELVSKIVGEVIGAAFRSFSSN